MPDCLLDAVLDAVLEDGFADLVERGAYRRNLRQYIVALAALVPQPFQAVGVTGDAREPLGDVLAGGIVGQMGNRRYDFLENYLPSPLGGYLAFISAIPFPPAKSQELWLGISRTREQWYASVIAPPTQVCNSARPLSGLMARPLVMEPPSHAVAPGQMPMASPHTIIPVTQGVVLSSGEPGMSTEQQDQATNKARQRRQLRERRFLILGIALLFLLGGATLWILNSQGLVRGSWSNTLLIIFTVLGVVVGLFQWLFPISTAPRNALIAGVYLDGRHKICYIPDYPGGTQQHRARYLFSLCCR